MNKIIDGKAISIEIKNRIKKQIDQMEEQPTLVVISVGDDPASKIYVHQKEKVATELGINYKHLAFDTIEEAKLITEIEKLNKDDEIDGIIVQLPLPSGYDSNKIINTISPLKDVDGLTYLNAGKLLNKEDCLVSCTPKGIMTLLSHEGINLDGKNVVVIGRSNLVGKPLFNLLINANATVTLCHSHSKNISDYTKMADIIIVAIGKKQFLTVNMVKDGAVIIDVGINRVDKKIYGDVDFDNVVEKASKITPVPGGVGPMTVIMLMENVLIAKQKKIKIKS